MGENCDIIDIRHSFLDINAYEKQNDEELTVPQWLKRNKRLTKLDRKTLIDGQVAAQRDISKHVTYLIFGETGGA
ncbi:hypothetical protein ACFX13_031646 [Malus domestica]